MAQYIKQGNIFGRIGTGIGQGLAEQVPKEIERGRLATGLKQLGEQEGLSPFQQFAALSSVPGITPQMIQSGAELLRQQGIAQGFKNFAAQNQEKKNPLREAAQQQQLPASPSKGQQSIPVGLITTEGTQAALQNYIPKTREQLISRGADLYDQNRELYPNPESALQAAAQEDQQNQAISQALQAQRQSQIGVENRIRGELQNLRKAANVEIPDNVFQQVENDVLDKIKEGKPETEAAKEGQKKLDEISRQYKEFDTIGNWVLPFKDIKATKRSIESLRKDFKERNDLENFADSLVGKNGLSYSKAYWKTYPVNEFKEVNSIVNSLPKLKGGMEFTKGYASPLTHEKESIEAAKKISPFLKSSGASPLAIAEELRMKNYDPDSFLDYLVRNKNQLDLSARQERELNKTRNWFPSLNDFWLFIGTGDDKILEE
jgi:hypothetical protein